MGYEAPELTKTDVLAAITDDDTRYSGADIDAAISSVGGGVKLSMLDFWGPDVAGVAITGGAADKPLSDVVIPNLVGVTMVKAYGMFTFTSMQNTTGALNKLTADTFIQADKLAAGYINAISMRERIVAAQANKEDLASFAVVGDLDISSRVSLGATTNFKWANAAATAASLALFGCRTGIRLIVS